MHNNPDLFNPFDVQKVFIYVEALIDLINLHNNYRDDPIDLLENHERLSSGFYSILRMMGIIHVLLPYKVDLKNTSSITFHNLEDSLFQDKHFEFLTKNLRDLHLIPRSLLFANYFLRNTLFHKMHQIDTPYQMGNHNGVYNYTIVMHIDRKQDYDYIKKLRIDFGSDPIYNPLDIDFSEDKLMLFYSLYFDIISFTVKSIRDSFVMSFQELRDIYINMSKHGIEKIFDLSLERYLNVIDYWIKKIPDINMNQE